MNNNKLQVYFQFNKGLTTINEESVKDIQIADSDIKFKLANARITNNILEVWSDEVKNPRFVKYGYKLYMDGILINAGDLPASTFSNLK